MIYVWYFPETLCFQYQYNGSWIVHLSYKYIPVNSFRNHGKPSHVDHVMSLDQFYMLIPSYNVPNLLLLQPCHRITGFWIDGKFWYLKIQKNSIFEVDCLYSIHVCIGIEEWIERVEEMWTVWIYHQNTTRAVFTVPPFITNCGHFEKWIDGISLKDYPRNIHLR